MSSIKSDIGRFGIVPEWILRASTIANAIHLFAILACIHADRETLESFPSRKLLASEMGCSLGTMVAAMTELKRIGALTVTPRHTASGDLTSSNYLLHVVDPGVVQPAVVGRAAHWTGNHSQEPESNGTTHSPRARARARAVVSPEFIEACIEVFKADLGEEDVREEIAAALNHTAIDKAKNQELYLTRWLNREVKWRAKGGSNGKSQGRAPAGRASSDSWRSLFADQRAD